MSAVRKLQTVFLSEAQWRVMDKLRDSGGTARFNGRVRGTIQKLEEMKLISYTFDVVPDACRGRHQLRYVATLTERGREVF